MTNTQYPIPNTQSLIPNTQLELIESTPPVLHIADHDGRAVTFNLDGDRFATQGFRLVLIGSSGSGKSYALAVLAEEINRVGYPFLVFDQESEFLSLAELPNVEALEIDDRKTDPSIVAADVSTRVLRDGISQVLSVGELTLERQRYIFYELAKRFYALAGQIKRRCFLLLDEAAEIAPQRRSKSAIESREWLERFARRGRKRGINTILATQRPADLSKSVFAQANAKLIGRVEIINDYDAIRPYLSQRIPLSDLGQLQAGQFLLDIAGTSTLVQIRQRTTEDLGWTPTT